MNAQNASTKKLEGYLAVLAAIKLTVTTALLLVPNLVTAKQNEYTNRMRQIVEQAAFDEGVSPDLLVAVCTVESNLKHYVTNFNDGTRHSHGLCQLQTRTAKWLGCAQTAKELYDPKTNATCAALYIRYQLKRYDHVWEYAIAAYNAGSLIKTKHGAIINNNYVVKVYRNLTKGYANARRQTPAHIKNTRK